MARSGGSRRNTGWMLAPCIVSMVIVASCAASRGTPTPAPASPDRIALPSPATTQAAPPPAPVAPDAASAAPGLVAPAATAPPSGSDAAARPVRRVLDVPYMRNLMPASAVGVEPGADVLLDVYAPETGGPWPVVAWAPGGQQKRSFGSTFGETLASRGFVVLLVDTVHAMTPDQPALGAGSRAFVEEASCAVRTARALAPEYGGDPERVVWSGYSLGGVYGFELALADPDWERLWTDHAVTHQGLGPTVECLRKGGSDRIDAIVTAGSGRFIEMWAGAYDADPALRAFTESVSHVGNNPSLVVRQVHGDPDPEQPFAVAQALSRELVAAGYDAVLTRIDLGGHSPFFDQVTEQILGIVQSAGWQGPEGRASPVGPWQLASTPVAPARAVPPRTPLAIGGRTRPPCRETRRRRPSGASPWHARRRMTDHRARKVAVVAIGGNSLISDAAHQTVEDQYAVARETTRHIADMVQAGWDVAIGHGNGPQVGFILRRSEIVHRVEGMHEVPLDVCGADSQGAIGYALQQTLQNWLFQRGIHRDVATIVTQVLVDRDDPAFRKPTKPIGGFMDEAEAKRREATMGWSVVEDAGRGWRRVVASPLPKEVVELDTVKALLDAGVIVITVGGGGIPVIDPGNGVYEGTAAVIDKDYASSLLAQSIGADLFLISTAVEKVALDFGKPEQRWLDRITLSEAKRYLEEGTYFAPGSMAPKIQAIIRYLEAGGKHAIFTTPENIGRALRGETGTHIVRDRGRRHAPAR